ncbi:MAG TPA: hypothetical protein VGL82_07495 [Bryobacteraceae bacterium]|jgi:hypothetical protein
MAFEMYRVFCATPVDLEDERQAFYQVVGQLNEQVAMPRGILLVPVSLLPHMTDKRAFQLAVDQNVRDCKFYLQVLQNSWGPPERNFKRDYNTASQYAARSILFKALNGGEIEPKISDLKRESGGAEFTDPEDFRRQVHSLLSNWLASLQTSAAS